MRRNNRNTVHQNWLASKAIVLLAVCMSLSACGGDDMADLKTFVADAYKDKKPDIEPLPPIRPFTPYEYAASAESDPFSQSNILGESEQAQNDQDQDRVREPLEDYPLDALRMVGTMTKDNQPWVIVKTSTGTALLATKGNYMGQNNGKIIDISTDRQMVVLSERVRDSAGRWVTREVQVTVDE